MNKIINDKGITLVTLVIYIVLTFIILGAVATITAHFRSNISNVNVQTVHDVEFDKLNLQLLKETKTDGNLIELNTSTATSITFTATNNTYSFDREEKALFLNNNIKVAEYIQDMEFGIIETSNGQSLQVRVNIDGKQRITEYIIEQI